MQEEVPYQPIFGFILTGIGFGMVAGVLIAYAPDFLQGAYEFPSVANAYYWTFSLGAPPIIGFISGLSVDVMVNDSVRRKSLLKSWRRTLFFACWALLFFIATCNPVY
jgi:MFS family permease